jgi:hypothetical protein
MDPDPISIHPSLTLIYAQGLVTVTQYITILDLKQRNVT